MGAFGVLFQFIGGLGMFLYGMNAMADGLQKSAGSRMQQLLGVFTSNKLLGIILGAGITALIQSSSATTVMVVGFVNAGVMTLSQAVGIIMGANIGTTVTSWIVSMNEWGEMLKPEYFAPLLVGIGEAVNIFSKDSRKRQVGEILVGFGFLFMGLELMSMSIRPYRDAPVFAQAFALMGRNPLLGILAGAAVTAVIQSSSASIGILQTLATNGMVNWQAAVFITLGQNIGTCVTALLSCVGAHRMAKRAAVIHLLFNCIGAMVFGIIMAAVFVFWPSFALSPISSVEISGFHTIFNLANTIVLYPFTGVMVKLSYRFVKNSKNRKAGTVNVENEMERHLDSRILENPSFAIEHAENEVVRMGETALMNLNIAGEAILENNPHEAEEVRKNEEAINRMEKMLTSYLVKISNLSLNEEQRLLVKNLFYTISDLERLGDHCDHLPQLAENKIKHKAQFSYEADQDLREMIKASQAALDHAIKARESRDLYEVRQVVQSEEQADTLAEDLRERHVDRLAQNLCTTENGMVFLDAVSNLEQISDHALNIAGYVRDEI